jgi:hypothetical protein
VAQSVRADPAFQFGQRKGCLECGLHGFHRLPIEFHEVLFSDAEVVPAPKVGQKTRGQGHRRLSLVGGLLSYCQPIEDATVEVNEGTALLSERRSSRNCAGPGACVEADQNESRQMS